MKTNLTNPIKKAAKVIQDGGIVLFPTETVYGIGANALNDEAVRKIFIAKGREQDNPLILHISEIEMLSQIAKNISKTEKMLMESFWPGPFTIILQKKEGIAEVATCGGDTVGVRMPSNPIAQEFIKEAKVPIAAPSANISGKPSGTKLSDIIEELQDKVDAIIDGGESEIGLESTVVRVVNDTVQILRPGKITKEDIQKVVPNVIVDEHVMGEMKPNEKVVSPGMKYRHYAPKTKCKLIYSDDASKMIHKILEEAQKLNHPLILAFEEDVKEYSGYPCLNLGSKYHLEEVSHNLFSALRQIDTFCTDGAIIEGVSQNGMGLAIMNRLIRACEHDYEEIKI